MVKLLKFFIATAVFTVAVDTMPMEQAVLLAQSKSQELANLVISSSPALLNYGIYNAINSFKSPFLIILGTEAAAFIALNCTQGDPLTCLSSLVNLESLQAVTTMALENLGTGATYALGEEVAQKALAVSSGTSFATAQTILSTLAGAGLGFYAWSMDPSIQQSMLMSMCSAVVLTSLTAASKAPAMAKLQERITHSLGSLSADLGKIIGVAAVASGTAALAYKKESASAVLGAITRATETFISPAKLHEMQQMVRANASWIKGYQWGKNMFSRWSY